MLISFSCCYSLNELIIVPVYCELYYGHPVLISNLATAITVEWISVMDIIATTGKSIATDAADAKFPEEHIV